MNKKVLGGVSALAVGVVGTGVYLAVPASAGSPQAEPAAASSRQPNAKPNAKQRHQARKALRRRAGVHGDATVRTKKNGFVQVTWQRGVLTAKSANGFTVRSLDGTTWQWQAAKGTKFHKDGQKADLSKLAVNDYVVVYGRAGAGNSRTANRVFDPKKVPAKATQSPTPQHS